MARPPRDENPTPVHIVASDVSLGGGSGGATTISSPLGRQADAASVSTALSTEDVALLTALLTTTNFDSKIGALTEAAPATDTASSGLNGRLQRIAQNITTLIAKFGTALTATLGPQTRANSMPVVLPTDATGTNVLQVGVYGFGAAVGDTAVRAETAGQTVGARAGLDVNAFMLGYNSTAAINERINTITPVTLLASAARTVTTNSSDQTNYNWRGLLLFVDVSNAGTGSITPSLQIKDSISGVYKTIWTAAAALIANGTTVYAFYPSALAAGIATEVINAIIGRTWRLVVTANNANSVTYSVSADMVR